MKELKHFLHDHPIFNDILFLSGITVFVLLEIYLLTGSTYIYGSTIDWLTQHSVLPDYFRQSFYETKRLFPEFNLNLGAGQNAYNFSYYGLMNPIILISYFLPFVPMETYISISSIMIVLTSIYIFYFWMKSNKYICRRSLYIATFLFTCTGPLLYQSHKQVMFMDYIPFLLLAFIGIDKLFAKNKKMLLIFSITLMFLTSYFFAVSGMIALSIYALYKYFDYKHDSNDFFAIPNGKNPFWYFGCRFFAGSVIGVMLSGVILLPSLAAILSGRGSSPAHNSISLFQLLIPQFPTNDLFYTPYGIGITGIAALSLIYFAFIHKNTAKRFLSLCIIFLTVFPLGQYILNGCLYIRGKSLIPFMPLVLLLTSFLLEDLFERKIETKKFVIGYTIPFLLIVVSLCAGKRSILYALIACDLLITGAALLTWHKKHKSYFMIVPIIIIAVCSCGIANFSDKLISKECGRRYYNPNKTKVLSTTLEKDNTFYRTSNITDSKFTNNIIYNKKYFSEGCYSSIFNKYYLNMCNYDLQLNNPTVNDISITSSNDVLFKTLMGVKYLSSATTAPAGYVPVCSSENITVYKSDTVYSLGFSTPFTMSLNEYKSLAPEDKELALLKYIVVDKDLPNVYHSMLKKADCNVDFDLPKSSDGYYHITTQDENKTYYFDISDNLKDYVYIIKCNIKQYSRNRATIRINGIQNSLSGLNSAYPNQNFNFKFVISDCVDNHQLAIEFPKKCDFEFSEFEIYKVKYFDVAKLRNDVSMMTDIHYKDNVITGKITLADNALFTTTIPYDRGFSVYVDGKKTDYEITDNAFLGFPLSKGAHKIKFVYHAPQIRTGKFTSLLGLVLLVVFCGKEPFMKRRKNIPRNKSKM